MKRTLRLLLSVTAALLALSSCKSGQDNYTVLISLDGSRWDYPEMYDMPFFDSLSTVGVRARMQASFPSSTFPNHYTMATGLVPDHHGLVNNSFWNPETQYMYSIRDSVARFDRRYYLGEPIWQTAQRQGVRCGVIYWVGSDIDINGVYPTYWRNWNEQPHWSFEERCDEIVRLLSLPEEKRPRLVMGYFDEPDHQGHVHGPVSAETKEMAEHMDSLMHALYLRLKALPGVGKKLNFILAGDHGMTEITPDRFIPWHGNVEEAWVERIVGHNPTSIWAKEGCTDSLYNSLSTLEHVSVWKKGEVPEEFCYGTSDRVGDLIVSPDLGWQFEFAPSRNHGTHGFDPRETDMMVAFRAVGPNFKKRYNAPFTEGEQSAFRNIDLYPMLCKLLGIEPAPVDGRLERIEKILR